MRHIDYTALHGRLLAVLQRWEDEGDWQRVAILLELWWLWAERTSGIPGGPAYVI